MAYVLICSHCREPLADGAGYWSLMPHVHKKHYSMADMERESFDFCSGPCFEARWRSHDTTPEAYFGGGEGAR